MKINKFKGIVDEPNPKGSEDTLDIYRHADALTSFIKYTSTPMTIGVQGEWGSGKTSLLNSIYHSLDKEGGKYLQIWINSWEHSLLTSPEQALLKIINAIINEMIMGDDNKARQNNIKETTGNLIKGALRLGAAVVGGSKGSEVAEEMLGANINSIKELRDQLITLAEEIHSRSTNPAEKIIIYVDDLDRIEPKDAVLVLELLKNIFSIPNCVFILAIDYQVVVKGLEHKFGKRTDENEWEFRAFFDKIIQLPFMMPMGQYNKGKYVSNLLYQIGFIDNKEKFVEEIDRVLNFTIGGNPRSLKRLVNSLALINIFAAIDGESSLNSEQNYGVSEDVKDMVLFSLVCLQISYPAIYELLVADPAFPNWNADTAFEVTKKSEENDKDTFDRDFAIVDGKEDFDEDWEKALFRICYVRPRYRSRVGDISKFFSYIKDEVLSEKKNEVPNIIAKIISDTAVTNVNTSDDTQQSARKPYQKLNSIDEWINSFPHQPTNNQIEFVKNLEKIMQNKFGIGLGKGKIEYTSRVSIYADEKKGSLFFRMKIEKNDNLSFTLLRNHEKNYYRPFVDGLNIENIRKYDPEVPSYKIPWGYPFYQFKGKTELINKHLDTIISLIGISINTMEANKKLKINNDNHHELKSIFDNDYKFGI